MDKAQLSNACDRLSEALSHCKELDAGPVLAMSLGAATATNRSGVPRALKDADRSMYMQKRARGRRRTSIPPAREF